MNRIQLIAGDITKLNVEAIVNAANNSLMGGGGVDGAIHRAGGPAILEACKVIRRVQGELPTGDAVITTAGNLKAKFVIHTVGPVWNGGNKNEKQLLANAYKNSLRLAAKNAIKTIAFPNISTGIYGFPKQQAAEIAVHTVKDFLSSDKSIELITFCCFDAENYEIYSSLLK